MALTFAASVVVGFVTVFGGSTTCGEDATRHDLVTGQLRLVVPALVLTAVWVAGALVYRRHRRVVAVGWLLGLSPLLYVILTHLRASDWVGTFCF